MDWRMRLISALIAPVTLAISLFACSNTPLSALLALQAADGGFNFMATAAGERLMATLDALDALLRPYPGDVLPPPRLFLPFVARPPI